MNLDEWIRVFLKWEIDMDKKGKQKYIKIYYPLLEVYALNNSVGFNIAWNPDTLAMMLDIIYPYVWNGDPKYRGLM